MPAVDMSEVTGSSQALTVDALGKGFAAQMNRQAIIADRKFDEMDIEQSIASRYTMTGQPNGKAATT